MTKTHARLLAGLLAATSVGAFAHPALAQQVGSGAPVTFNIPAGDLGAGLRRFVRQSRVEVIYSAADLRGRRTQGVSGSLTPPAALERLVEGSGASVVRDTSGAFLVRVESPGSGEAEARGAGADSESADSADIVVVGSRLGTAAQEGPQPVRVVTRADIDRTGANSAAQALNYLPELSLNSSETTTQTGTFGGSSPRLRGLPLGTSLVLLNGRRVASSGLQASIGYFDLSTVPIGVIQRLEVMPTGSSAVYGGDGLGGVVNIVLRNDVRGFEADIRHGQAAGYSEDTVSLAWGHSGTRGSVTLLASYSRNSELRGTEREITASSDFTRFGGPDARSVNAARPGNIYSLNNAPLPGLASTFAAVPIGSTGIGLARSDFIPTAGQLNRGSPQALNSIIGARERYGAMLQGTYELFRDIELFTELSYFRNSRRASPGAVTLNSLPAASRTVSAQNPFNPFGVAVRVDFTFSDAYRICDCTTDEFTRVLLGARGSIGPWNLEIAGWTARSAQRWVRTNQPVADRIVAALNSTDPNTALNVFQDGPGGSRSLIETLLADDQFSNSYDSNLYSANAIARGPLLVLPAGTVRAAIGGEFEHTFVDFQNATIVGRRDNYAVFGELQIPVLNRTPGGDGDLLRLSGAVRHDEYSDFGGRTSVGAGIELRPLHSILMRGSYSTAFKPPLLVQLFRPLVLSSGTTQVRDPQRNGAITATQIISGGNPELGPQTGQSWTAGIVFSPSSPLNFRASATYWNIRLENGTILPTAQQIVDNESLFPGRVTRNAAGIITLVNTAPVNFGYISTDGIDFAANLAVNTNIGRISPSISLTYTRNYEIQVALGSVPQANVNIASTNGFAVRWKATAGVNWEWEGYGLNVIGRYLGPYRDYAALSNGTFNTLGGEVFIDANLSFDLNRVFEQNPLLNQARLSVGVINALNNLPEYSNFGSFSFDPNLSDIRGRFAYARLQLRF